MSSGAVRVERRGPVTTIILSRPTKCNAVDGFTATLLKKAFDEFERDATQRVAVLYGEGGTFCAGADLSAISETGVIDVQKNNDNQHHNNNRNNTDNNNNNNNNNTNSTSSSNNNNNTTSNAPRSNRISKDGDGPMGITRMQLSKPVIAAICGYAVAGGLELALACDLRVCSADATFGVFCRRWGVPLIDGGNVRLPRLIGLSRALDLVLTGRPVHAHEALDIGLVNRVVPFAGEVRAAAEGLALRLASFPQVCMNSDRLACHECFGIERVSDAISHEFSRGVKVLASGETLAGATTFAGGTGRHGRFDVVPLPPYLEYPMWPIASM